MAPEMPDNSNARRAHQSAGAIGGSALKLTLTPMIDIVFQLIAFFVFSLTFEPNSTSLEVNPPEWNRDDRPGELLGDVLFELDAQGRLLSGHQSWDEGSAEFQTAVERELAAAPAEGLIVIRADQNARFHAVDEILTICRRLGRTRVAFRLRRTEAT